MLGSNGSGKSHFLRLPARGSGSSIPRWLVSRLPAMAWFRSEDDSGSARDPDLPLSVAQAQRLRDLVRVAWAKTGREVTVHSDHVVDADGDIFGLWDLAAMVAGLPARKWPGFVSDQVRDFTAGPSIEALSDSELRAHLVLSLVDNAAFAAPSWFSTAPTLAGGLRQVLALDFPPVVITPDEAKLAAHGDLDEWRAVGRANLWEMMRREPRDHQVVQTDEGSTFDVLFGDVFTASMAIFLPELISMVGHADLGRGVLVAVPMRHQVAFRVIDGSEAVATLHRLFGLAMAGCSDGVGALSPHVYWVKDGNWEQVTEIDEDGPRLVVGAALAEALGLPDS